jgi:pimeloyl-ACP methyl ester carboxylesterase
MKTILIKTIAVFILVFTGNKILYAQSNADSIKAVNEAIAMIQFPEPEFREPFQANLSPKAIADMGFEQPNTSEVIHFKMSDDIRIHGQKYAYPSNKTVLLLHGVLSSSYTFNKMAGLLREALQAEIIAIDIRGHGQSGGVPGDVSTLNQYAEDLDEVIQSVNSDNPDHKVILAGHSMGGGIVLRHAETFPETGVAGYLLFAPNMGHDVPTTSKELDLENNFIKVHLSRGMGLRMLNEFIIHRYDSLKVVFYNMPKQMPLRSYSYRSMEASAPANFREALRSINKPLLVVAGSDDEAFIADEYLPIVKVYSNGACFIIEGETHNGVRHNEEAMEEVKKWAVKIK